MSTYTGDVDAVARSQIESLKKRVHALEASAKRDDFATAALIGLISSVDRDDREFWNKLGKDNATVARMFAEHSYQIADAMLKTRRQSAEASA